MENKSGINIFKKYLTVWVILCMGAGILIGRFLPQIPEFLNRFEYLRSPCTQEIAVFRAFAEIVEKADDLQYRLNNPERRQRIEIISLPALYFFRHILP